MGKIFHFYSPVTNKKQLWLPSTAHAEIWKGQHLQERCSHFWHFCLISDIQLKVCENAVKIWPLSLFLPVLTSSLPPNHPNCNSPAVHSLIFFWITQRQCDFFFFFFKLHRNPFFGTTTAESIIWTQEVTMCWRSHRQKKGFCFYYFSFQSARCCRCMSAKSKSGVSVLVLFFTQERKSPTHYCVTYPHRLLG